MATRVLYFGHVQGVGFRQTTFEIARNYDIRGFVRNLSDGSVELIADGSDRTVDAFLRRVQAEMDPYISDCTRESVADTTPFEAFTIRR